MSSTSLTCRDWLPSDYDRIVHWWDEPGMWGQRPPRRLLAGLGVLAEADGDPVAAVFMFHCGHSYGLVSGAICNRAYPKPILRDALALISSRALERFRDMGVSNPRLYVKTPGYLAALEGAGMEPRSRDHHSIYICEKYIGFLAEEDEE